MSDRFSDAARAVLERAGQEASRLGHGRIGTEHLVLGLFGDGRSSAARALLAAGATLDGCRSKVVELVGPPAGRSRTADLELSERARRVVERSERLSLRRRHEHVEPEHILVSLLDVEGRAGQVLRGLSVDVVELRETVAAGIDSVPRPSLPTADKNAVVPRCSACWAELEGALARRVVGHLDGGTATHEVIVAYCASCGATFGTISP